MKNVLQDHANIHRVFTGRNQNILPQVKNILFVVPLLLASFNYDMAFAFTYQTTVDISFTFNSTATLSISGDLVIENLTPGNSSDSNIITISASSNNIVGYDIKATVGDSTHSYTDLRRDGSDTTNIFTPLSSNVSTLNSFSNDTWGYSYSTDDGASWVSGNTGSTNTGYNGLPLYTGTGVKLADTSFADTSTIQFKIGAKAGSNKVSGDYTNVINFQMTSKILTTNYTLNYLPNDGNNGQDVSSMPNPATVSNTITQNTNYTLSNSTPTRSGYTFAGWCDGTVTNEACSGTTYQPGDAYVIRNTGGNSTINLNAVWEMTRYSVVVTFNSEVSKVSFINSIYGTEEARENGSTVRLIGGEAYTVSEEYSVNCSPDQRGISVSSNIIFQFGEITANGDGTISISPTMGPCW